MSSTGGAYGAGGATGSFNFVKFTKKPEVILRFLAVVFSIVVFGCIADAPYYNYYCPYNDNHDACNFGIVIGVFSLVGLLAFLVGDAMFDNISNIKQRKSIVIADVLFSTIWGFMWLVCFSFLTDQWRRTYDKYRYRTNAEAAIAFSFFCFIIYVVLSVLAIMKLRAGVSEDFAMPTAPPEATISVPPSHFAEQDPQFSPHPFSASTSKPSSDNVEPPAY